MGFHYILNPLVLQERVSNGLDPDQDRRFVGSDQDPNRLQRLSADNKS